MLSPLSHPSFETDFQFDPFTEWDLTDTLSGGPKLDNSKQHQFDQKLWDQSAPTPEIEEFLFDIMDIQRFCLMNEPESVRLNGPQLILIENPHETEQKNPLQMEHEFKQIIQIPKARKKKYVKPQRKLFNNMPGFLTSSIHKLEKQIGFDSLETNDFESIQTIEECFKDLKKLLKRLSSKEGSRKHLRMVLNDIDDKLNNELSRSKQMNKVQVQYFFLLASYPDPLVNEAKRILRTVVYRLMTRQWIVSCVQSRQFIGKMEEKKEIFEKYLKYFKNELFQGQIGISIDKKKLLGLPLFLK